MRKKVELTLFFRCPECGDVMEGSPMAVLRMGVLCEAEVMARGARGFRKCNTELEYDGFEVVASDRKE